MHGCAIMMECD